MIALAKCNNRYYQTLPWFKKESLAYEIMYLYYYTMKAKYNDKSLLCFVFCSSIIRSPTMNS